MRLIVHPSIETVPLTAVLHAMADPVRLKIVRFLATSNELPCCAFAAEFCLPKATLSHHFKVLREAGVIHQRGEGTQRLTSLRRSDLNQRFPGLLSAVLRAGEPY